MTRQAKHFLPFGPFVLDPAERVLLRNDQPISLTPKAMETLLALVDNAGHITEKDRLLKQVWPDTFVEEATLAKNISTLRKALGDSTESEDYIQTVSKRGYRFVAAVSRLDETPVQEPPVSKDARVRWAGLAVLILAVTGMGIAYFGRDREQALAHTAANKVTLAVLPFENLSGDTAQEYFADGLTEEMIGQLSRLRPDRLAVIARTSAMKYKGVRKGVAEIGGELHADFILEGSVRREGNRVRITAQLVRVIDQALFWTETYEREMRDVLALQGEVAHAAAGRIGIELREDKNADLSSNASVSADAYEKYLKGRFFWNKMTVDGYQKAIEHFDSAVRRSPKYAQAYAGLSDSYASLGLWQTPGKEALGHAKAAADKAIAVEETLADGHASRAFIAMSYEWDWETADREFKRALELNPGYAFAHHRYGYLLMLRGRWNEAGEELNRARALDPLSMIINANVGFRFYLMRQYDRAIAHGKKNLEMDADYPLLHGYLGEAYVMNGQYPEALAEFEQTKGTPGGTAAFGYTYGRMGRAREARQQLTALREEAKQTFVPAYYVALLYTGLGEKDEAFRWLDRAYEERSGFLMEIHADPMFDLLRGDPRFRALTTRLGSQPVLPVK